MTSAPEIPADVRRDMKRIAREILGSGYVDDYYNIIVNELVWAYELGADHARTREGSE